jgi:hypothetical protein
MVGPNLIAFVYMNIPIWSKIIVLFIEHFFLAIKLGLRRFIH